MKLLKPATDAALTLLCSLVVTTACAAILIKESLRQPFTRPTRVKIADLPPRKEEF